MRFDENERIVELINQKRARRERSVTGSGHTLAMTAAASGFNPVARLSHQFGGLAGIKSLKSLDDSLSSNEGGSDALANLVELFTSIHDKVKQAPKQYMLTLEADKADELVADFEKVWQTVKGDVATSFSLQDVNQPTRQMWVANTQVNFCSRAYPTVTMEHPDAPALSVLGGFMRNGYLHTAIREQGGAYGGGASHDTNIAAFRFYSYRDPRLVETLADFDAAIDWVLDNEHEERQLEEAILGVIGSIDKPGSPAGEARAAFHNNLHGRTRDKNQLFRQRVLGVTLDDLKRVTRTYLKEGEASTAVITSAATQESVGDLGLEIIKL